jgi:hypothetical protein
LSQSQRALPGASGCNDPGQEFSAELISEEPLARWRRLKIITGVSLTQILNCVVITVTCIVVWLVTM